MNSATVKNPVFRRLEEAEGLPVLNQEMLEAMLSLDNHKGVFLDELIDIYLDTTPQALENLILSFPSGTPKEISRLAHKVKGMVANLGAQRLTAALETIEISSAEMTAEDLQNTGSLLRHEHSLPLAALRDQWHSLRKING